MDTCPLTLKKMNTYFVTVMSHLRRIWVLRITNVIVKTIPFYIVKDVTGNLHFTSSTPFTQGLRLCASLLRPQFWPGHNWRHTRGLGRSMVVHTTLKHRNGRHGRREVLSMFKTVIQMSLRRSVTHRSLKGGRRKAHELPWSQNVCTVVGHWWPRKKVHIVVNILHRFGRRFCLPWTTSVPPLADQCCPLSNHCGDHCASIRRLRYPRTTLAMALPLLSSFVRSVVPLPQFWSFREGTRVVL